MRSSLALLALVVVLVIGAAGCESSVDAQAAPVCTEQLGCPDGTICVDGMRCEAIGDQPVHEPPRMSAEQGTAELGAQPPRGAPIAQPVPGRDGGAVRDAGQVMFDAGPVGFDAGDFGFDSGAF